MKKIKLQSWNVNGIRAGIKKGFFDWLYQSQPDILGLQETKIDAEKLTPEMTHPEGYQTHWSHAEKKGYSGVALFSKLKPLSVCECLGVPELDREGRVLLADYGNFMLYNIYYPNGQRGDERLQYKMDFYDAFLAHADKLKKKGKNLVICGDVNTAHKPIDLARPKENEGTSGFLPIERAWMDKLISHGYIDTFRHIHPDAVDEYSWWNMRSRARERNVGWRIDYFFVSESLEKNIVDASIEQEVEGSDHCPVTLVLKF